MGNSLHFPFIQKKRRLYQCLAVSGGAGVGNPCFPRKVAVNLLDGADTGSQGIAVIVAVEGIEQGTILTDQGCLCCGGTRVNAQITVSAVAGNVSGYDIVVALALIEFVIILPGGEQRLHTVHLKFHMYIG